MTTGLIIATVPLMPDPNVGDVEFTRSHFGSSFRFFPTTSSCSVKCVSAWDAAAANKIERAEWASADGRLGDVKLRNVPSVVTGVGPTSLHPKRQAQPRTTPSTYQQQ